MLPAEARPIPGVVTFLHRRTHILRRPTATRPMASSILRRFDPVAQALHQAPALIPSPFAGRPAFHIAWTRTDNRNELTTKFDFNLNAKDKISATFGFNRAGT